MDVCLVMFSLKHTHLTAYSSTRVLSLIVATIGLVSVPGIAQVLQSAGAVPLQSSTSAQPGSGRLQPSYQVFAQQVALPLITATTNDLIVIGSTTRLDIAHRDQMLAQLKPLSEQFAVPASALLTILKRLTTNGPPCAQSAARELQASLIDYKYLLQRWTQYRPPPSQETVKASALQLLEAGELDQVWHMYNSLQRPKPPAGLRIVDSH